MKVKTQNKVEVPPKDVDLFFETGGVSKSKILSKIVMRQ